MRELKFRGWDKEQKKMYYIDLYEYMAWNEMKQDEVMSFKAIKNGLMQFTGLKDKNGKEIYEGDLLNDTALCPKYTIAEITHHESYDGMYFLNVFGYDEDWYRYEVVGNIYENQDLLQELRDSILEYRGQEDLDKFDKKFNLKQDGI